MPNWFIFKKLTRSNGLLNFILHIVLKFEDGGGGGEEDVQMNWNKLVVHKSDPPYI